MIFEQPLSETMRLCLRLETLFHQVEAHMESKTPWQSAFAMSSLLELLSVIDRPDLKSKLTKVLSLTIQSLSNLSTHSPDTSSSISQPIRYLQSFLTNLQGYSGKIGHDLYTDPFLKLTRSQLSAPGGSCPFNAPEYYLWLQQPGKQRASDLADWLAPLSELKSMIQWLLAMIRQMAAPSAALAEGGFYQKMLDTKQVGQLVRIILTDKSPLYPVFSVGRHRLAVHFYSVSFRSGEPAKKWEGDVTFNLAYCALG